MLFILFRKVFYDNFNHLVRIFLYNRLVAFCKELGCHLREHRARKNVFFTLGDIGVFLTVLFKLGSDQISRTASNHFVVTDRLDRKSVV